MELWFVGSGLYLIAFGALRAAEHLKRMADVAERRERMQREADAIHASIGSDVARELRSLAHNAQPPRSHLDDRSAWDD